MRAYQPTTKTSPRKKHPRRPRLLTSDDVYRTVPGGAFSAWLRGGRGELASALIGRVQYRAEGHRAIPKAQASGWREFSVINYAFTPHIQK
jgi:hypothetical protein